MDTRPQNSASHYFLKYILPIILLVLSGPILIWIGRYLESHKEPLTLIIIPTVIIFSLIVVLFTKSTTQEKESDSIQKEENEPLFLKIVSTIGLIIFALSLPISFVIFINSALGGHSSHPGIEVSIFLSPVVMLIFYIITNIEAFKKYRFIAHILPFIYALIVCVMSRVYGHL